MTTLAVAAFSARLLAEAAALDGHSVVALDLFGDADTRRVADWRSIGAAGSLQIDDASVLGALSELANASDAPLGWIAGTGFEGRPELLDAGARLLPLIGTPAAVVRRVRDPGEFFAALSAHGIAHPEVRFAAPTDADGWLLKDAKGSGGWHIRPASAAHDGPGAVDRSIYFQRAQPGVPMSATFIGHGSDALLLGINELIVRPFGQRPHVYCGCVGPVDVPVAFARRVFEAVRALTAEFGLRGWCSLDFIRDGDTFSVLEINPRPPASLALYAQRGLIDAQLRACLHAELPPPGAFAPTRVAGTEIVYARRPWALDDAGAARLADRSDVHDLPGAGAQFEAGDPVCSLSAVGDSAGQVRAGLRAARAELLNILETT